MKNLKLALKAFYCVIFSKSYFLYTRINENKGEYFMNNMTVEEGKIIMNFMSDCIKDVVEMEKLGHDIKDILK